MSIVIAAAALLLLRLGFLAPRATLAISAAALLLAAFAGLTLPDIDRNGSLDLYVTNYRTNDVRDAARVDLQTRNGQVIVPPALQSRFILVYCKVQEYG